MIKRFVIAWIIGTVSLLIIGFGAVLAVGLVVAIGEWDSFTLGLGQIEFMTYSQDDSGSYSPGSGWAVGPLAIIGGLLNGLGAVYFGARNKPAA